jgi:hypothetical protein
MSAREGASAAKRRLEAEGTEPGLAAPAPPAGRGGIGGAFRRLFRG